MAPSQLHKGRTLLKGSVKQAPSDLLWNLDPRTGFEPIQTESESVVLPLDDRGMDAPLGFEPRLTQSECVLLPVRGRSNVTSGGQT